MKSTPRQARSRDTRARLLEAGRRAFAERGHDGVNLARDILGPANVRVGSFYYQFEDKTDLLVAILADATERRRNDRLHLGVVATPGCRTSLEEGLATMVDEFFDSLDRAEHAWDVQINTRSSGDPRVRRLALDTRQAWVDELASSLRELTGADPRSCERSATLAVSVAVGVATTYLDLPPDERAAHRAGFLAGAQEMIVAGSRELSGAVITLV